MPIMPESTFGQCARHSWAAVRGAGEAAVVVIYLFPGVLILAQTIALAGRGKGGRPVFAGS